MLQVFMREGLSCPYLFRYVHEREDVFAELLCLATRSELKDFFIITLHLGNYFYYANDTQIPFITNLLREIKRNVKTPVSIPIFAPFYKFALKEDKTRPLSTTIAFVCQAEESKILHAKMLFTEKHSPVAANLFDGSSERKDLWTSKHALISSMRPRNTQSSSL